MNDEANQYNGASTGAATMSTATIAHSSTNVNVFTRATSTRPAGLTAVAVGDAEETAAKVTSLTRTT
ncbi:hypothetical protein CRM90_14065 [Mycobacterium sp. ENV421]|nr:hypothetical protein CRM90_14065 [Mycobacterium sp. ENV421]